LVAFPDPGNVECGGGGGEGGGRVVHVRMLVIFA